MSAADLIPLPWRWRAVAVIGFVAFAVALLAYFAVRPPVRYGDGWEYAYHLEALCRHGSPELRDDDLAAVNARYPSEGLDRPPPGAFGHCRSPDGRLYGIHFWAYSLSAVPAKFLLAWTGGNELAAFQMTNVGWFLLALGVTLFGWSAPLRKRLLLAGLVCVGPTLWYLPFTGAEVFSWSLAVLAVIALDIRRYGPAAAAAGLAAMQNPPLVFLAGAAVLLAVWRQWWSAVGAVLGTGLAFVPAAFYYAHFGTPSLIARDATDPRNISFARTWGLAADLNQGLLPYAPLLLIAAIIGAAILLYRRNAAAAVLLLALAGMATAVQVQVNWHSGCLGLLRYLLWMVPLLAWLAVEGLWTRRTGRIVLVAAIVIQGGIVLSDPPTRLAYLTHGRLARWVFNHAPQLYNPEPAVFVSRTIHQEFPPQGSLPVGYVGRDGWVTKLLIDAESVDRLPERFVIDPNYHAELRRAAAARSGPFYVHPRRGTVWSPPRPDPEWLTTE